ncbi:prephenate dehydratase [Deinobacterium chartae]|uniref:Prephenate dehydratase n=1 Tax=Deinobacterium chartae TaxID=521158 RepID=A0A841HVD0_9DEIO|nr:prephenate dehydratase [Deinobacterium chartae]MBB6097451.1 prephenate dehydratase [Deinobacterium chartae]
MQVTTKTRVAFQGVPGAYSEIAALRVFEGSLGGGDLEVQPQGYPSFHDVLEAVRTGECERAALPIENSLAGGVIPAMDLLLDSDLRVIGEVMVRVRHQLLALPGTRLEDLERVHSHPQALAQCAGFLKRHGLQPVPAYDTAGSAQDLLSLNDPHAGCIASRRAGELYGLEVLASDIEDEDFNTTRFFVLSRERLPFREGVPYKTSLVFAVGHHPGDLVSALAVFRDHGINLSKIESRPRRNRPWSYLFFVDLEGHTEQANVRAAMSELTSTASMVRVLGSYPSAEMPL